MFLLRGINVWAAWEYQVFGLPIHHENEHKIFGDIMVVVGVLYATWALGLKYIDLAYLV